MGRVQSPNYPFGISPVQHAEGQAQDQQVKLNWFVKIIFPVFIIYAPFPLLIIIPCTLLRRRGKTNHPVPCVRIQQEKKRVPFRLKALKQQKIAAILKSQYSSLTIPSRSPCSRRSQCNPTARSQCPAPNPMPRYSHRHCFGGESLPSRLSSAGSMECSILLANPCLSSECRRG